MPEWRCPVCGAAGGEPWVRVSGGTEGGVDATAFAPSSDRFGAALGTVVRCRDCGHGAVDAMPDATGMSHAYADAADPVSVREERGQVETARRALEAIEAVVAPGSMVDLGCWTGSFLVAAEERGWRAQGVEPSAWAVARARARGLDVHGAELESAGLPPGAFRLVVMCDVLEHLERPGRALEVAARLLEPGGALFVTVPDAGSTLARLLRRRWWSVLPMHLQYFNRSSLRDLLAHHGFSVRSMTTHPKAFSVRYYAERLGGYDPRLERLAVGAVRGLRLSERLVAPDFRDRVAVVATAGPAPPASQP